MKSDTIPQRLLKYLKTILENPYLDYKITPNRIGQGFETYIYKFQLKNAVKKEFSRPMILRLYPENIENMVYKESIVQNYLNNKNYPAAKTHVICRDKTILGGEFLVMDFLPGNTLYEALPKKEQITLVAETHVKLHEIDPTQLVNLLKKSGFPNEIYDGTIWSDTRAAHIPWLKPAIEWIKENASKIEKTVIYHGDFHPNNILVIGRKITGVLDWSASHIAEPERDVASTYILSISFGPWLDSTSVKGSIRFADEYLAAYRSIGKLDMDKIEYYKAVNCVGYLEWFETGGNQAIPKSVINRLLDCFKELSGVSIHSP